MIACCLDTLAEHRHLLLHNRQHDYADTKTSTAFLWIVGGERLPDIELLPKQEVVVEMGDGAVYSIAVSHLHHGCPRLALHELNLSEDNTDQEAVTSFSCVLPITKQYLSIYESYYFLLWCRLRLTRSTLP